MGASDYLWAPGEEPPVIQDHSLAKHEVLSRYLRVYVEVLTVNVVMDRFRLTLVDGFAGGGSYLTSRGEVHHGSPLQMIHAMQEAQVVADTRRKKDFLLDVDFFFVEKKQQNLEVLEATLRLDAAAAAYARQGRIHVVPCAFEDCAQNIIDYVSTKGRAGRVIFLLDQYGYSGVPLSTLRTIFSRLPNAEVLLTFATDWLIDYMSAEGTITRSRLGDMGLLELADQFDVLLACRQHRDPRWRRLVQSILHHDLVQQSGAKYFTPFFIVSPKAHREYWFVHLSGHSRARDEMAKLHWALENRFAHYGRHGLGMLGYDPREDVLLSAQLPFNFSGASSTVLMQRLMDEIPRRLHGHSDGIGFADFFDGLCNETPATRDQFQDALRELSFEKRIEILDANAKVRRLDVRINGEDRVRLTSQVTLDFGHHR